MDFAFRNPQRERCIQIFPVPISLDYLQLACRWGEKLTTSMRSTSQAKFTVPTRFLGMARQFAAMHRLGDMLAWETGCPLRKKNRALFPGLGLAHQP